MVLREQLTSLGFDWERLSFALRCALGSCAALLLAWLAGLEHPQWAAMTVWAASQPARGMLLEKSLFRFAGTVVGTGVGVLFVLAAGDHTLLLACGLALWVATCAAAGNVLRGLVAYGTLLAGYSASMVALLGSSPGTTIFALGIDRLLTILLGVTVAVIVGMALSPRTDRGELRRAVMRTGSATLHALAARLAGRQTGRLIDLDGLVSEIAGLEEGLDAYGAGSLRARREAHALHAALAAQMELMLWLRHPRHAAIEDAEAAAVVKALAAALEDPSQPCPLGVRWVLAAVDSELAEAVAALTLAVDRCSAVDAQREEVTARLNPRVATHRDWVYARHVFVRTAGLLLLIGAGWAVSGEPVGAYVMLGTSVMVTLFSTYENPAWIMRNLLLWQAVGASAALACRWLLWPLASSELGLILLIMPLIFLGVIPIAHRRTMWGAMDYTMILLLLLQPSLPLTSTPLESVAVALAVVTGPVLAWIAFKVAFPTDAERRWQRLRRMMIGELRIIANASLPAFREQVWQARLYHRAMKLVHWNSKLGHAVPKVVNGCLAVLELGQMAMRLRALLKEQSLAAGEQRAVRLALGRLTRVGRRPAAAAAGLDRAAGRLQARYPSMAGALRDAATLLRDNQAFFDLQRDLT